MHYIDQGESQTEMGGGGGCHMTSWRSRNPLCVGLKAGAEKGTQWTEPSLSASPQPCKGCTAPVAKAGGPGKDQVQCVPSRTVNHAE